MKSIKELEKDIQFLKECIPDEDNIDFIKLNEAIIKAKLETLKEVLELIDEKLSKPKAITGSCRHNLYEIPFHKGYKKALEKLKSDIKDE